MFTQKDITELADIIQEGWSRVTGTSPSDEVAREAAEWAARVTPVQAAHVLDAWRQFNQTHDFANEDRLNKEVSKLLLVLEEQGLLS